MDAYVICAQRVRALRETGYEQLAFCLAPGQGPVLQDWAQVVETI